MTTPLIYQWVAISGWLIIFVPQYTDSFGSMGRCVLLFVFVVAAAVVVTEVVCEHPFTCYHYPCDCNACRNAGAFDGSAGLDGFNIPAVTTPCISGCIKAYARDAAEKIEEHRLLHLMLEDRYPGWKDKI